MKKARCMKLLNLKKICCARENPGSTTVRVFSYFLLDCLRHFVTRRRMAILLCARALLPQWGKSVSARTSVSLAPVLGARALETGRTICQTMLQWILPQWVLPQWGTVCHQLDRAFPLTQWNRRALGTEQDYLGPSGVLWIHNMAWYKNVLNIYT